jgi:diguanylate cyclase (GGDEF)-like protein/PAS domain S-box-containing protein
MRPSNDRTGEVSVPEAALPSDWYGAPVDEELVRICAHNLLAAVDEAIYFKDRESRFVLVSRGQARRLGAGSPAEVVGRSDSDFFGEEHASRARADEREILRTGEPLIDSVERLVWPGVEPRWVTATKMVLRDFEGRAIGTFGISHDITARVLAERDAEAKSQALAQSHAALLESEEQLLARQRELEYTAEQLQKRAAELAAIADVARAALSDEDVRSAVCSAVRQVSDADIVTLLEPDGKGNLTLTAFAGPAIPRISIPVSQASIVASVYTSKQPRVVDDVHAESDVSKVVVGMLDDLLGHSLGPAVYAPIVIADRCLGVLTAALPTGAGEPRGLVPVLEILAQEAATALDRADLHRLLQEQATQDVLTGLSNRRAILEQLDRAIARARRHNRGLGLLYVDLDGFKTVNDSYGHASGDAVLVEVAARLRETLRLEDSVGRIGGDEFVVVCEDLEGGGESLKTRLAAAIGASYAALGVDVPLGASVGIAVWRGDDDADTLLARADHAMYADKAARGAWPGSVPSTAVLKSKPRV